MELNRFKQLLESTMGNVKPLISEQVQTTESLSNSAIKEIANATGMELHPQGHTAILEDSTKQKKIVVSRSIYGPEDTTIGFTIETGELDTNPNDENIENPLQVDILNTMGDVSFLGKPGGNDGSPTNWGSIPVTPENTKKIIELINKVKPKLGL